MNKLKMILLLFVMIFIVSCKREIPTGQSAVPVNKEISTGKRTSLIVIDKNQISYGSRLKPNALTEKQLKNLGEYISKEITPSQKLWFVHVRYNEGDYLTATIYLKPQCTEGRIRKGQYFGYDSKFSNYESSETPAVFQESLKKMKIPEYMQVSLKDAPFKADLEIPPQNSLFPFGIQEGFSDQEIVEISDFIRSSPSVKSKGTSFSYPEKVSNLPVISITREGEFIDIRTGSQEGMLSGGGESVRIKKTDSGYELDSIGVWYS